MLKKFFKPLITSLVLGVCLFAGLPAGNAATRFVVTCNGQEVIDNKTGLIWKRCTESLTWDPVKKTCNPPPPTTLTGTALTFTLKEALTLVNNPNQTDCNETDWRLPNIKELSSIVDRTALLAPAISTVFPRTQAKRYWSSTPFSADTSNALVVDFQFGIVETLEAITPAYVRLVRAGRI